MSLVSIGFFVFLVTSVLALRVTPRGARLWLLALLNLVFFYVGAGFRGMLVLLYVLVVSYVFARLVAGDAFVRGGDISSRHIEPKLLYLLLGVALVLVPLLVYKYASFALGVAESALGLSLPDVFASSIAPLGISFFTMQAIGYVVDVYKGRCSAITNVGEYVAFAAFFPTIVSGPIQRTSLLPQQLQRMRSEKSLTSYKHVVSGAITALWGLFLKMVIADRVALFVNTVYDAWWLYESVELVLGTFGYALQVFCDFAGYSCIAIGAARMMGIDAGQNFNTPYLSQSIQEFWRRWHISLSTWLRDYIYIPLGGSRRGTVRRYVNVMVVFLVCGVWHGAGWHFVVWGLLQGVFQCVGVATYAARYRLYERLNFKTSSFGWQLGRTLCTFLLVSLTWVFFRASSMTDALGILGRIVSTPDPWALFDGTLQTLGLSEMDGTVLLVSVLLLVAASLVKRFWGRSIAAFLSEQPIPFAWGVVLLLVAMVFLFGMYGPSVDPSSFIYAQF